VASISNDPLETEWNSSYICIKTWTFYLRIVSACSMSSRSHMSQTCKCYENSRFRIGSFDRNFYRLFSVYVRCGNDLIRFVLNWHHIKSKIVHVLNWLRTCHENVWGSGCVDSRFLDLDSSWRWVVSFTPPGERALGTHLIGGWVNPRAGLNDMKMWRFLTPLGLELLLGHPAASQSLFGYSNKISGFKFKCFLPGRILVSRGLAGMGMTK
jgi:hypothetical protein